MAESQRGAPRKGSSSPAMTLGPDEIAAWMVERHATIAEAWSGEILGRISSAQEHGRLIRRFCDLLVRILPETLGPLRDEAEVIWLQVSELFGSVSAQRGLAAGEVMEEFQIVREVLIRLFYVDPPRGGSAVISLRDRLHVNRIVDLGVTRASVGHTDALFFALFQGSGVPGPIDDGLASEIDAQLDAHQDELSELRAAPAVERSRAEEETSDAAARK